MNSARMGQTGQLITMAKNKAYRVVSQGAVAYSFFAGEFGNSLFQVKSDCPPTEAEAERLFDVFQQGKARGFTEGRDNAFTDLRKLIGAGPGNGVRCL